MSYHIVHRRGREAKTQETENNIMRPRTSTRPTTARSRTITRPKIWPRDYVGFENLTSVRVVRSYLWARLKKRSSKPAPFITSHVCACTRRRKTLPANVLNTWWNCRRPSPPTIDYAANAATTTSATNAVETAIYGDIMPPCHSFRVASQRFKTALLHRPAN